MGPRDDDFDAPVGRVLQWRPGERPAPDELEMEAEAVAEAAGFSAISRQGELFPLPAPAQRDMFRSDR